MKCFCLFVLLVLPVAHLFAEEDPDCTILGIQDHSQVYQDLLDAHAELQQTVDSLQFVIENPPCGSIVAFGGRGYETVQIGDQCWFAENLRTTTYADGTAIPAGLTDGEWGSTTSGATAVYGEDGGGGCDNYSPDIDACDETQSLAEYGRLYNWYAVDDARGLCPSGWHVPTDGEWTVLETYITSQGFSGTEGTALKSTYGWSYSGNGTDDFEFSALPGGYRYYSVGYFDGAGYCGVWWSSSLSGGSALSSFDPAIDRGNYGHPRKRNGFSVRCLRDAD